MVYKIDSGLPGDQDKGRMWEFLFSEKKTSSLFWFWGRVGGRNIFVPSSTLLEKYLTWALGPHWRI